MASGAAHRFVCLHPDRYWSGHVHGCPRHPRRTGRNGLTASARSVESQPVIFRASTFPDTDSPSAIMFKASIHITLRPSILDPQGKATHEALTQLGFDAIEQVRMGKVVELWIDAGAGEDRKSVV